MTTALLLENPDACADDIFASEGIEVRRISGSLDEAELIEALQGVQILGIRSKTEVTARVIEAAPDLLAIGAYCIGTNQIDLEAASRHGVAVFNAPYSNTRSVVELAIAEIIMMGRRLVERNNSLHQGVWNKSASHAHEIRGRTLGIIGYGSIGTQLSVLAEAMGLKVIFYDRAERLALGNARRMHSMEEVLQQADVVSMHVSGEASNTGLIGDREFSMMKPRSLFINLSRGHVVDLDALRKHLLTGHIAGAAVDVFPHEPKSTGDPFESPLADIPNVILTPHIGGSTVEAQEDIARFVSGKLSAYLGDAGTYMSVNFPSVSMPRSEGATHRLALMHFNVPGVMGKLNRGFAKLGVNVVGQSLGTKGEYGYALTDISGPLPEARLGELAAMESTIRLRYLDLG
ncbi:phosphoglycerate dehydrogenase [Actinomyces sp. F1_1611]